VSVYDVERLQKLYEQTYGQTNIRDWQVHDTRDPILRYLRDRRLQVGVDYLCKRTGQSLKDWDALVVCGGVGGEGTYLANRGFRSVTVSDFSAQALEICRARDPRLQTVQLNAEALALPDNSYDVVLVQDGLHELRRPVLGLTEMLRVARRAAIIVEPHSGIIARLFGTVWEQHETGERGGGDHAENYVFRWDAHRLRDVTRSYLMKDAVDVTAIRFWDHNVSLRRVADLVGGGRLGLTTVKAAYLALNMGLWWMGNAMVGIVLKNPVVAAPVHEG
jgi:SAM-dependent methyltransferase